MKNYIFLLIIFLFATIITGCEEDVIEPIVVKGTAYAMPTSVNAGEPTTIYYSTDSKDVTTVTVNGIKVPISAGSVTYTPTTTTDYTVKFIGPNNEFDQKSLTVRVVEPPIIVDPPIVTPTKRDTIINLLSFGSFKKVKKEWKINGVWDELTMGDLESRKLLIFTKDGKFRDYDPLGTGLDVNGEYTISSDFVYLAYGGRENEFFVNEKQLILIYWASGVDPITNKWVEKHTPIRCTYDRVK